MNGVNTVFFDEKHCIFERNRTNRLLIIFSYGRRYESFSRRRRNGSAWCWLAL